MPLANPLQTFASLSSPPHLLASLRTDINGKYRIFISEDMGDTWTSFGPTSYPDPSAAIEAGEQSLIALKSARTSALDSEVLYYLNNGRLQQAKVTIQEPGQPPIEVDGYRVLADSGEWVTGRTPAQATQEAVKRTKARPQ